MKIDERKIRQSKERAQNNQELQEQAEQLAISALGFLGAESERLDRFLSLSGLPPTGLRAAATQPGFLAAVLDHLASDERLHLACAEHLRCDPAHLARARHILSPEE